MRGERSVARLTTDLGVLRRGEIGGDSEWHSRAGGAAGEVQRLLLIGADRARTEVTELAESRGDHAASARRGRSTTPGGEEQRQSE